MPGYMPSISPGMVAAAAKALVAGSSRPFLQRLSEGVGQWLWTLDKGGRRPRRARYFSGYAGTVARLLDLQRRYPALVRVSVIGPSSQTRDGRANRYLYALTLGSAAAAARSAPPVLHIAGVHANEVANSQVVLGWAENLLARYGSDPFATGLLDSREVTIVPLANPDGNELVAAGYDGLPGGDLMRRKNATPPDGVNINRNYGYKWRSDGGAADPTSGDYAGPAPDSESETQSIERLVRRIRPGLVVDWHSAGQMVLWPWGYTSEPSPDEAGFRAIGKRFAAINGYHAMPGTGLYPTAGSIGDWVYHTLRVPALTVETGLWMHQSDAEVADNLYRNTGVLDYAAQIASNAFELAGGPALRQVGAGLVELRDEDGIDAIELVTDPDAPWGSGVAVRALDGRLGDQREVAWLPQVVALADARSSVAWLRARDRSGRWGAALPVTWAVRR